MNDIFFLDESSIKTKLKNVCDSDIIKILKKTANFTIDDFIALISEPAEKYLEELAQKALSIKIQRFGKTIKFYCPLYVSNKCINNCLYCGFKATNFARRKTLNFAEIESEALKIKEFGFDNILIVSGEQPDEITMDYLLKTIEILIKYFSYIGIEIYPLSESEYKALSNAGVDGLTLYQETYNLEIYKEMHKYSQKQNFNYRLAAIENGAKAGIKELTLGILLGLYDWRIDSVFLAQHAKYLIKKYWRSHINISFPRIRPSVSDFQPRYPVSDKNLAQLIIALRIVFQDAGLNLSTREPAALRDNLVNLGITHLSAGSKTNPGGYNINDRTEEQFKISDERSPYEIADTLKSKNIDVVWKDWDKYLKI